MGEILIDDEMDEMEGEEEAMPPTMSAPDPFVDEVAPAPEVTEAVVAEEVVEAPAALTAPELPKQWACFEYEGPMHFITGPAPVRPPVHQTACGFTYSATPLALQPGDKVCDDCRSSEHAEQVEKAIESALVLAMAAPEAEAPEASGVEVFEEN